MNTPAIPQFAKSVVGIIPARYASTRFPGKPLAMLGGKPMIQHVFERASEALADVFVATDDERIFRTVEGFGGRAVMTSPDLASGTERVRQAYQILGLDHEVVVNIQGDEPFVRPAQIAQLAAMFDASPAPDFATLARPFPSDGTFDALADPNLVKVVLSEPSDGVARALYFSRSVVPYIRGTEETLWPSTHRFYTHIGIYAYSAKALASDWAHTPLQTAESLEQLAWLQHGASIAVGLTDYHGIGIDTPADLTAAVKYLESIQ